MTPALGQGVAVAMGLTALLAGAPGLAGEVRATAGALGLGTAVNGRVGGSCGGGLCQVGGGKAAGRNLFHRFSAFDTRGGISGVNFATGGHQNVFVGVTNPLGSFIDKLISFSSPGNLFWLSPGGIAISGAGGFANIQQLNLSTATGWRVGNGIFDAAGTTAGQAALLSGTPLQGSAGPLTNPASLAAIGLQKNGDLSLSGGLLTVDQSLLLDAQGGNVLLQAAGIQAPAAMVAITGASVSLESSTVDVSGPTGGGKVLLGGGLRGADPTITNAQRTGVDAASAVRADATGLGSGGTVVIYGTDSARVEGALSARGGPQGGDGGLVETSGRRELLVSQAPDASASNGKGGTWLIDPKNVMIQAAGPDSNVTGPPAVTTTGDNAVLTTATVQGALNAGTNVSVATSAAGTQEGNITVASPINKTAGGDATLTLTAHNNINLNASISSSSEQLNLSLNPDSDASGSGASILASGATLALNGGTAAFNGSTTLAGTIIGSTITGSALTSINATLQNITFGSNLTTSGSILFTGSSTTLADGTLINWSSGDWSFSPNHTLQPAISGSATITKTNGSGLYIARGGPGALTLAPGLTLQGFGSIFPWSGPATLNNQGTIRASTAGQAFTISPTTLNNSGTLGATTGNLSISTTNPFINAGVLEIGQGSISTGNRSFTNGAGGTIRGGPGLGGGNLDLGTGTLTNLGTINPGGVGMAGALRLTGNLALGSTSVLNLDLGGATPGSQYDQLAVSGNVNIGGTINAPLINGFSPSLGQNFDGITSGGMATGSFTSSNLRSGFNGAIVGSIYRLTNSGLSCLGTCWDGGGGTTNWETLANWNSDQLPTAIDVAYLNLVEGVDVTLSSSQSIKGLNSIAGNNLTINSGGSLTLNDSGTSSTLAGSLTVAGALDGSGNLTLAGGSTLSGGVISGSGLLITDSDTLVNGLVKFSGKTLNNLAGRTVTQSRNSKVFLTGTNTVNNAGVWRIESSDATPIVGVNFSIVFNNSGTLTKAEGSAAITTFNLEGSFNNTSTLNNTGTLNVDAGTLVLPSTFFSNDGLIHMASGATLVRRGGFTNTSRGTLSGSGTIDVGAGNTLTNLGTISPGGIGVPGILSLTGELALGSTSVLNLNIGGSTPGSQYDQLSASGNMSLAGAINTQLINAYNPSPSQNFDVITSGGTATGSFASSNLPSGFNGAIIGSVYRLTNSGLSCLGACWDGGGGTTNWETLANWSSDQLPTAIDVAYLNLVNGVDATLSSSQIIKGLNSLAGNNLTINSGGSLTLNDPGTSSTLNGGLSINGGVLTTNGALTLNGSSQWAGGSLNGPGVLTVGSGGTLVVSGGGSYGLSQLTNQGTLQWTGGNVDFSASGVINNSGLFDVQTDGFWGNNGNFTMAFNNLTGGELRKSAGLGTASLGVGSNRVNLTNDGLVNVSSGTLAISPTTAMQNNGRILTASATTFQVASGGLTNTSTGTLSGFGTIDIGAGNTLTNLGTISPGGVGVAGTLSLTGGLILGSSSVLNLELGGLTSGSQYDRLAVSGNVNLGGTINTQLINGFSPSPSQNFDVIASGGAASGSFASSNLPSGFNGAIVGSVYRLTNSGLSCSGVCWDGGGGDTFWETLANWSSDQLPTAIDVAYLNLVSGVDVILSSRQSIKGLNSITGNSLTINPGGSLTLSDPGTTSTLTGDLTVAGTLTIQSPLTASSLAFNGGILNGNGSLTVTNAFTRLGGTTGTALSGVTLNQASGDLSPGAWAVNGPVSFTATAGNLLLDGPVSATTLLGRGASGLTLQMGASLNASASTASALVLDAGTGAFTNLAGAGALAVAPGAHWLVFSASPLNDNRGGLSYAFKQYGIDYGSASPVLGAGNGFLYRLSPTITASLTGSISKTYDSTVAAPIASGNYFVSGTIDGDTIQLNNPTLGTYTTAGTGSGLKDVGSGKGVSVAGMAIIGASEAAATVYGYQLASPNASGTTVGAITPLALTGAAIAPSSSIYGSALSPGAVSFDNLFAGDLVSSAASVNTGGVSSSGNPIAGSYSQTASSSLTGSDAANYSFSGFTTGRASYTINPLNLFVTGVSANNKVYDGTTSATLNTTTATFNGLVAGDSVSLDGSGFFADPNVGLAKRVVVNRLTLSGPDAANYSLIGFPSVPNEPSSAPLATADISIRPLATWKASTAGNWSDASNWDALPSGFNVAVVAIPAGSGALIYDAAAGSTSLQNLYNNQSLNLTGGSLTVSGSTTVGAGATLSLNGGNFTTVALLNQGLLNGSGPLVLNGIYTENGGSIGSDFSSVAITQSSGNLNLGGVGALGTITLSSPAGGLNLSGAVSSAGGLISLSSSGATQLTSGSSLTSPGALIFINSSGPLNLTGARVDASGGSAGGTVQLDGSSINLSNTMLNTSGAGDGGSIQIGLKAQPSSVTISNSSLIADPPALGGSITIDAASIAINGSALNVFGLSGGSIVLGSANTDSLSLDAFTSLVGGGEARFNLFGSSILNNASIVGGRLFVNGVDVALRTTPPEPPKIVDVAPIVALPTEGRFQLSVNLGQVSPLATIDYTAPGSALFSQWAELGIDPLAFTLTQSAFLSADLSLGDLPSTGESGVFDRTVQQLTLLQVQEQFTTAEQRAMEETAAKLGLDPTDRRAAPSPSQLQASLREVINAVRKRIRGSQP
ncbi:hypothetical protein KQ313_10410 [Synechococcus sp. CS-1325]|uniref:YDG domain-containing protein n=1 Tax=unclassified Synechococcus TaxID=2626047 RepID=UPI0021A3C43C|nr:MULTISPECIES: YDG domain-containing protein [unclassified Synechococcus]MCT0200091.1 hypothetical protein [Synechococcus sp. CS-1325]MCT0212631.1 hypothetical protein [Synechococcus sp. CS-1326]MCT0233640.1 hypothetical protein [Synechococcus sp. CS-1327]